MRVASRPSGGAVDEASEVWCHRRWYAPRVCPCRQRTGHGLEPRGLQQGGCEKMSVLQGDVPGRLSATWLLDGRLA